MSERKREKSDQKLDLALIVSGSALIQIFSDVALADAMMDICNECDAVLCCRVAPIQKAEVVQLVRRKVRK